MLLSDYINQVQELVHDSSSIDYTTTELTGFINNARTRVALDFHCIRQFFTPLQTIVNQEIYPMSGGVGGAVVTNGGLYVNAPTVSFNGGLGSNGVQATGVPIMTGVSPNLTVSSIQMTSWGSGYIAAPSISFNVGAATATAIVMLNVLDNVSITVLNGSLRTTLLWWPFTKFQAFARSNITTTGQPLLWTNYTEQNRIYLYPALPDQNYVLEIDAVVGSATPLVNLTDSDNQINPPMNDCVQYYAAHLALLKQQNFEQAEYYNKKYETRQMKIQLTRQTVRNPNVYQNNWRRVQRGW